MNVHPGPYLDEQKRIITVEVEPKHMRLCCEICGDPVSCRVPKGTMQPFIMFCRAHKNPTIEEYIDGHVKRYGMRREWAAEERISMSRWANGEGYY